MAQAPRRPFVQCRWLLPPLVVAWLLVGGQAWGQAPPPPAGALERAAALLQARAFGQAAALLRDILSEDPANRRAKEMLAFDLESMGNIQGELRVRSALAAEFPDDPRIQTDYGRVLERSGEEGEALRAYRRARELSADTPASELDAAIERMRGRTAVEIATPLAVVMSDPDASASGLRAGVALPLGSRR